MKELSVLKSAFLASEAIEQEVDLDTTPIMNVLIILIPFLASVAVYIQLSVLNMSLPPNVSAGLDTSAAATAAERSDPRRGTTSWYGFTSSTCLRSNSLSSSMFWNTRRMVL